MANIAIGDKVIVTFRGTSFGQRIINTFGFVVSDTPPLITISDAMLELKQGLEAAYGLIDPFLAAMPSEYTLGEVWCQVVGPTRYRKSVFAVSSAGTFDEDCSTANLAGVITRHAEPAGRRYTSALHLLAPTGPTAVINGLLQDLYLEALQDLADKIVTFDGVEAGEVTFTPSIPHPLYVPVPSPWTPIVTAEPRDTARVMRRRTVRVGE